MNTEGLKKIKLLILDVDGVLTDGRIIYDNKANELKFFDVQDGFGIVLLKRAGIPSAIMTAKRSKIVSRRARDFKIDHVYQNCFDKLETFEGILKKFNLSADETCFIGDDLIDIPVLKRVGFAVSVPNAVEETRNAAHYITKARGGWGAVREICDLIIKAQGKWQDIMSRYSR